jgi:hypothetical protein
MTTLFILQSVIIWSIIGVWISYKRDWYPDDFDSILKIVLNIFFMPIALIIAFSREFIAREWTYHK